MNCWICNATSVRIWKNRNLARSLEPADLQITDSRYGTTLRLWQCQECGFIFADGDELKQLTSLYSQMADPGYLEGTYNRSLQMRWLIDEVLKDRPHAQTALEIGAGIGLLAAELKLRGIQVDAIEPSHCLVAAAKQITGVDLIEGTFPHAAVAGRKYDLVFLVDVIEHVENPLTLLRDGAEALSQDGVIVVVTPDVASLAARVLGKRWWHLRLAHVGYFDRKAMATAARLAGLRCMRKCHALWFFPIRYLAERMAVYLPIAWFNRLAVRLAPLRWLYNRTIPVNLGDSFVYILTRGLNGYFK